MTKEEIEYLSKFERNYYTALHSNSTSAIWNDDLNAMLNIYKKYKGDYNLCKHCSASILAFVKKVGLMYEEENNKIAKEEENKITKQGERAKKDEEESNSLWEKGNKRKKD